MMMIMMLLNINYNMAVGYKIYLHTNTDQLEWHKYKMKSIRKMYSTFSEAWELGVGAAAPSLLSIDM
jgi:Tfp pilus assembly protein PilO